MIGFIIIAVVLLTALVALIAYSKAYERQMAKMDGERIEE